MADLVDDVQDMRDLEHEFERSAVALCIDWNNDAQVRTLARAVLDHIESEKKRAPGSPPKRLPQGLARLFEQVENLLRAAAEHPADSPRRHGAAWKALVRALWIESNLRDPG